MQSVYIGLGSNLGDSGKLLQTAATAIAQLPHTQLLNASSLYSSAPLGPSDQPRFINAVLHIETGLQPLQLLDALQAIEQQHGRVRKAERWGPRTLDLDILLFGQQQLDEPRLRVPHYHMHARPFVLLPLHEISGDQLQLPSGQSLSELIVACPPDPSLTRLARLELLA